jgi:hypothetical protein
MADRWGSRIAFALYLLILRSREAASRRMKPERVRASWFETALTIND